MNEDQRPNGYHGSIIRLQEGYKELERRISKIEEKLEKEYVHKNEFRPIEKIGYGLAAAIFIAVVGAVLKLVVVVP